MMNEGGFRLSRIEVEQSIGQVSRLSMPLRGGGRSAPRWLTVIARSFYYSRQSAGRSRAGALCTKNQHARYKQPRPFHPPCKKLPMGANGKLLRRSLRAAY